MPYATASLTGSGLFLQLWNSPDGESCCGIRYYPG